MLDSSMSSDTTRVLTDTKGVTGSIVRILPSCGLVEVQLDPTLDPATMPGVSAKTLKSVLVDLSSCLRVLDDKGGEKKHDDRTAWFTKDEDWVLLKVGARVKIETRGTRQIPAPKVLQEGGRASTSVTVHTASAFHLLPAAAVDAAKGQTEGSFEGAIVALLPEENVLELKVESAEAKSCAGHTGETVLLHLGTVPLRSKQSSFIPGVRVRVQYSGVRVVPSPQEDAAARGKAVVYEATAIERLP